MGEVEEVEEVEEAKLTVVYIVLCKFNKYLIPDGSLANRPSPCLPPSFGISFSLLNHT